MNFYLQLLRSPKTLLGLVALVSLVAAFFAMQFRFDASSETLVVAGDPDLLAYESIAETFGGDDFLLLTFQPTSQEPFSDAGIVQLQALVEELEGIEGVSGTLSILDVPLLKSPPIPLSELSGGFKSITSDGIDLDLARAELSESPLFRELLVSKDGTATGIRIDLLATDTNQIDALQLNEREAREAFLAKRQRLIDDVRIVRDNFSDQGTLFIGGVPMIAADMIAFVGDDLMIFGVSVVGLIMLVLWFFFRRIRWMMLPILTSALATLITVGVLGYANKPATVISSNFIALLVITTVSLIIHLIVQYRELLQTQPDMPHTEMVLETMRSKFAPCLYTTVTTIAAFGSLMASRIVPVEDFGWMMCLGIGIAFLVTFSFFPAVLILAGRGKPSVTLGQEFAATRVFSEWARWRFGTIILLSAILTVVAAEGISRVSLDNRFVDYFRTNTDISQGMHFIDKNLGGTIPFDVVLQFAPYETFTSEGDDEFEDDFADDFSDDFEDDFSDDFADEGAGASFPERYWFTRDKLDKVEAMHRFLHERPEIGKVMSVTSLEDLARGFTDGRKLTNPEVAGVLGAIPEDLLKDLLTPYASPATGQFRLNVRIRETAPSFDRDALVQEVRSFAENELQFSAEEVQVSGMMVLFNSMLKQLFDSQVDTLAYVLGAAFLMLLILLRSITFAILGLLPNLLAAATVIAFMGFTGIPLDMMTTTIAAVSIGIGVDDAIHYLHRFQQEFKARGEARQAVAFAHANVGRALYFTSLTIIAGFSVMAFSSFVPTILFGVLVAVAMALALFANLTLLPALLVWLYAKPMQTPVVSAER